MNAKNPVLWISLFVIALFAGLGVTQAQTGTKADAVATITNLENDGVKADLAGDTAFYQKVLAEDWTRGDSDGTFYTKAEVMKAYGRRKRTSRQTARNFLNSRCACTAIRRWRPTRTPMTFCSRANIARTPSSPRTLSSRWAANGSRSRVTALQWRSSRL